MNKQIVDAVIYMNERRHAGEYIDRSLLRNVIAIYAEIGRGSRKYHAKVFEEINKDRTTFYSDLPSSGMEEKLDDHPMKSGKKVYLQSPDGDTFVVNYDVALMLKSIKGWVELETNMTIPLKVRGKILVKVHPVLLYAC